MTGGKKIILNNVQYSSISEAAREIGVNRNLVSKWVKTPRLMDEYYANLEYKKNGGHFADKPITIGGVEYPSRAIAAEVLGVKRSTVSNWVKRGAAKRYGKVLAH